MLVTLEQLNKQTKQKITVEDLAKIDSNSTIIQNAINNLSIPTIVVLTEAEYTALATKDPNTLYLIKV